jgi:hypothetical protein
MYSHVAPQDIHEHIDELSFLYNHSTLKYSLVLGSIEKDIAMWQL